MSYTEDVLAGYATLLANAGLGVFNPTGVYTATQLGIFFKIMPDAPDRCIVLNIVPLSDEVNIPLGRVILQIAARGARNNPLDVDRILDPIFDFMQNRTNDIFGTTTVVQCLRMGAVPMGQDALVRTERADKYDVDLSLAPTVLRPVSG